MVFPSFLFCRCTRWCRSLPQPALPISSSAALFPFAGLDLKNTATCLPLWQDPVCFCTQSKESSNVKLGAGCVGVNFHSFIIVSKLKMTEHYLQLKVQDSHQGTLPLLNLQHQVQICSLLWSAPAPEYLHETGKADLANSLF